MYVCKSMILRYLVHMGDHIGYETLYVYEFLYRYMYLYWLKNTWVTKAWQSRMSNL